MTVSGPNPDGEVGWLGGAYEDISDWKQAFRERDALAARLAEIERERDELREGVERIIDALDENWADNADFEGFGDVEGMVRTVQTLCRRYSEEDARADAAEARLAAVRSQVHTERNYVALASWKVAASILPVLDRISAGLDAEVTDDDR